MNTINVRLGDRSYQILIEVNFDKFPRQLKALNLGTDAVIITNAKINSLFGKRVQAAVAKAGLRSKIVLVPDSEKAKSIKEAVRLLGIVAALDGKGKRICVVAFGGGVVGDLAGFVASIYKRGIAYVQVPTTLLAQVDSSIGGKVAIDLAAGKNLTGSFYQPRLVYADVSFINSLSDRDFASGMAEIIKYGIIKDKKLFAYLESNRDAILRRDKKALLEIISRCGEIKANVVSKDERESKSIRTILNFGHTVGHAIEASFGYSGLYSHGEAVGLGMIAAARISNRMGRLLKVDLLRIEGIIASFGLPVKIKAGRISIAKVMKSLAYDKKFIHGVTRLVLPIGIGKVEIKEGISEDLIRQEIDRLSAEAAPANDR